MDTASMKEKGDVRNDLCSPLSYIMYSQPWSWAAVHVPLIEQWQYLWFLSSFGTHPECSSAFQSRRPLESLWGFTFIHSHSLNLICWPDLWKGPFWNTRPPNMHISTVVRVVYTKCGCPLEEVLPQQWCENEAFGAHQERVTGWSSRKFSELVMQISQEWQRDSNAGWRLVFVLWIYCGDM